MVEEFTQGTNLLIFDDQDNLYETAAVTLARLGNAAVAERGRFLLVLSGGKTPLPLYRLLARRPFRDELFWTKTYVSWADERLVPRSHDDSNHGQASSELLEYVPIPASQICAVDGTLTLEQAVLDYANKLAEVAGVPASWPRFDLVILGIGADGHTASLFPGIINPTSETPATLGVPSGHGTPSVARVTLTPAVINDARHIMFLATGTGKAEAVARTLSPCGDALQLPGRRIQPNDGQLAWFVDRDASALLRQKGADTPAHGNDL